MKEENDSNARHSKLVGFSISPNVGMDAHQLWKRTPKEHILYCIASSSLLQRLDVVERLLDNTVDWCEAGFHVTVIIDTFDVLTDELFSQRLSEQFRCSNADAKLTVSVISHPEFDENSKEANNLVTYHRGHFKKYLHQFDLYVFGEQVKYEKMLV